MSKITRPRVSIEVAGDMIRLGIQDGQDHEEGVRFELSMGYRIAMSIANELIVSALQIREAERAHREIIVGGRG